MPYPAARRRSPHQRHAHELRRRPRLPVPVQLLHDHQRPGPQVAQRAAPTTSSSIVRANLAQGVHNFFITDDNLARNQNWEAIFDRLIKMREEEGLRIQIVAQVDTMAHKIRGFIEKAGRAGVNRVFIGLENINPDCAEGGAGKARTRSPSTARCCRRGTASAR